MNRLDALEKLLAYATPETWQNPRRFAAVVHNDLRQLLAVARAAMNVPRMHSEFCAYVQIGTACDCWRHDLSAALIPVLEEVPDAQA
jgi:hypothetical protein